MSYILHLSSTPRQPQRLSVILASDSPFITNILVCFMAPFRWALPLSLARWTDRWRSDSPRHHSTTQAQSVMSCDLLLLWFHTGYPEMVLRLYENVEIRRYNYNRHCIIQNRIHHVLQNVPLASLISHCARAVSSDCPIDIDFSPDLPLLPVLTVLGQCPRMSVTVVWPGLARYSARYKVHCPYVYPLSRADRVGGGTMIIHAGTY